MITSKCLLKYKIFPIKRGIVQLYKYRVFLSEDGYQKALSSQKHGDIRIFKHARVIEGHILYDTKKHQMSR